VVAQLWISACVIDYNTRCDSLSCVLVAWF